MLFVLRQSPRSAIDEKHRSVCHQRQLAEMTTPDFDGRTRLIEAPAPSVCTVESVPTNATIGE